MDASDLTPMGRKYLGYIEMDDNERLVAEIRKHPFGLLLVWLIGLFIAVSVMLVTIGALYVFSGDRFELGFDLSFARPFIGIIGFIVMLLDILMTGITSWLYRHNIILVTTDKVAEITYVSIFNRKITQLDLADIQDVAVEQKGIFPRVFGYGTLLIETAGEQENVHFTYAPFPYQCAKGIVGARESRKGITMAAANAAYAAQPAPNAQPPQSAAAPVPPPMTPNAQPGPGPGPTNDTNQ